MIKHKLVLAVVLTMALSVSADINYSRHAVMIEMRDGVRLYTEISAPVAPNEGGSPVLLMRTPYSLGAYDGDTTVRVSDYGLDSIYLQHGYIMVQQNVRGTFLSEGSFEQVRPFIPSKQNGDTDESTDAYDTIEWLIGHLNTNGCVGVKGTSYPGFYATLASLSGHTALKAVSPQAPVSNWWKGDDIHHNGAFMIYDIYDFGQSFFQPRPEPTKLEQKPFAPRNTTAAVFFAHPMSQLMTGLDTMPFWSDIMNHPDYDGFWQQRDPTWHLKGVKPAMMVVGGLYDAEDCYGAWHTWRQLRKLSPGNDTYLVEGPWYHGGWNDSSYDHLDDAWFGTGSAEYFKTHIEYPFFACYLEGKGKKPSPVTLLPSSETSQKAMAHRSSRSQWQRLQQWPPIGMKSVTLKLNGPRTVVSDPLQPVPYMDGIEKERSRNRNYMASDQSFASSRPDVMTFDLGMAKDTICLMGPVSASICLATSGTDLDVIVKLIDVRPDGYQMLIRGDVMPARYRIATDSSTPIKSGEKFSVSMTMPDVAHMVMPGHRLMVQVQFTCFPLVAVCPQQFVTNRYRARAEDYQKAEVTFCGGTVTLPVAQ